MSDTRAFAPLYTRGGTGIPAGWLPSVTLAATATAQQVLLPMGSDFVQLRIANQSASWAYVNVGIAGLLTVATAAGAIPIAPGAVEILTIFNNTNAASVILGTGTGSVTFTRGSGL